MIAGRRVLIVDDNRELAENLHEILSEEGLAVEVAISGREALEQLERGDFALVITDLRMPGLDGIALLEEVGRRWPALQVLIITAYIRDAVLERARSAGVLGVLSKPLDLTYLVTLVSRVLSPEAPVLLVEDDSALRSDLAELLLAHGEVVPYQAASLREARALSRQVAFRAAIVDVRLPDGSGLELGHELQARAGSSPAALIYITGHTLDLEQTLSQLTGSPVRVLEKPFHPDALLSLVAASIGKREGHS